MIIIISGSPGSGKTTIAYELAAKLGIKQVIQTDIIKDIFHLNKYPEIALCATHDAWRFFGEKDNENIIKGFNSHAKYFEKFLIELIEISKSKGETIIIEGIHATPRLYSKLKDKKIGFFLTINKEERIRRFDLKNLKRTEKNRGWYENIDAISVIEDYLKLNSQKNKMIIIDNNIIDHTIKKIREYIKNGE